MGLIGLDFETYGAVDLPTHGLERYVSDDTFLPLIACATLPNESICRWYQLWDGRDSEALLTYLNGHTIVAHNAAFEQRVLKWMGLDLPASRFIDSAVVARASGAGSKLEAAAPQLLGIDKLADGHDLIKLFSIPGPLQEENGNLHFDPRILETNPTKLTKFYEYCELDARLSWQIASDFPLLEHEYRFNSLTMEMNSQGWTVDIDAVKKFQDIYDLNLAHIEDEFRKHTGATELNLNSLKQLKEWCKDRGINAKSFDEKAVVAMLKRIRKKLDTSTHLDEEKVQGYHEVLRLLRTKQQLGGSSLKKLQVILNTHKDGKLYGQYMHVGAGQSCRTSGVSVQMQNLKRLGQDLLDIEELKAGRVWPDNDSLAENMRQLFTAEHPRGALIVGDFSSVESRGLAWLAGEEYKLDAYRNGKDMYKVLASKIYDIEYHQVQKSERQTGKVGELSCGYGAGAGAVVSFAEGMGVDMDEAEAAVLVNDWRAANVNIVQFWHSLDAMLQGCMNDYATHTLSLPDGYRLMMVATAPLASITDQMHRRHNNVRDIHVYIIKPDKTSTYMARVFRGVHRRGRDICYVKPSSLKSGNLWLESYRNPKTGQVEYYKLYGGKLAGIITQSLCREIFFRVLHNVELRFKNSNVKLVGQFHDEIVLDGSPFGRGKIYSLEDAIELLKHSMSEAPGMPSFPMAAEVNAAYRYIK